MAKTAKGGRLEAQRYVALNRKARRDYNIQETMEAGLALMGSEVKGLRSGGANLNDAYAREEGGEIWLLNAHVPEYKFAHREGHDPKRPRKLLLHKRQVEKLIGATKREGITVVPLALYFNARGIAKVELGLAKGRRKFEKREVEKKRDWQREKARVLKERS